MKNQQFIILYISKFPILQQIWQHFTLTVNHESDSFFFVCLVSVIRPNFITRGTCCVFREKRIPARGHFRRRSSTFLLKTQIQPYQSPGKVSTARLWKLLEWRHERIDAKVSNRSKAYQEHAPAVSGDSSNQHGAGHFTVGYGGDSSFPQHK